MDLIGVKLKGRISSGTIGNSHKGTVKYPIVGEEHHKFLYQVASILGGEKILSSSREAKKPLPLRIYLRSGRFIIWITHKDLIEGFLRLVSPSHTELTVGAVNMLIQDVVPLSISSLQSSIEGGGKVRLIFKTPLLLPNSYAGFDFLGYLNRNIIRRVNYIWGEEVLKLIGIKDDLRLQDLKLSYLKVMLKLFRPLGNKSFRGVVGRLGLDNVPAEIVRLLLLAEYSGVGVKTSYGYGTMFSVIKK